MATACCREVVPELCVSLRAEKEGGGKKVFDWRPFFGGHETEKKQ